MRPILLLLLATLPAAASAQRCPTMSGRSSILVHAGRIDHDQSLELSGWTTGASIGRDLHSRLRIQLSLEHQLLGSRSGNSAAVGSAVALPLPTAPCVLIEAIGTTAQLSNPADSFRNLTFPVSLILERSATLGRFRVTPFVAGRAGYSVTHATILSYDVQANGFGAGLDAGAQVRAGPWVLQASGTMSSLPTRLGVVPLGRWRADLAAGISF